MKLEEIAQAVLDGQLSDEQAGHLMNALDYPTIDYDEEDMWAVSGDEDNNPNLLRADQLEAIRHHLPTDHKWRVETTQYDQIWIDAATKHF